MADFGEAPAPSGPVTQPATRALPPRPPPRAARDEAVAPPPDQETTAATQPEDGKRRRALNKIRAFGALTGKKMKSGVKRAGSKINEGAPKVCLFLYIYIYMYFSHTSVVVLMCLHYTTVHIHNHGRSVSLWPTHRQVLSAGARAVDKVRGRSRTGDDSEDDDDDPFEPAPMSAGRDRPLPPVPPPRGVNCTLPSFLCVVFPLLGLLLSWRRVNLSRLACRDACVFLQSRYTTRTMIAAKRSSTPSMLVPPPRGRTRSKRRRSTPTGAGLSGVTSGSSSSGR